MVQNKRKDILFIFFMYFVITPPLFELQYFGTDLT